MATDIPLPPTSSLPPPPTLLTLRMLYTANMIMKNNDNMHTLLCQLDQVSNYTILVAFALTVKRHSSGRQVRCSAAGWRQVVIVVRSVFPFLRVCTAPRSRHGTQETYSRGVRPARPTGSHTPHIIISCMQILISVYLPAEVGSWHKTK